MWSFLKIIAWAFVLGIVGVIVFVPVRNSLNSDSGGKQASDIITAGTGGLANVIRSLTGRDGAA